MYFGDPLTNVSPKDVQNKLDFLSKFVFPVLATLIPITVTSAFKWAQDHSHQKRRDELAARVSTLAKSISELPALPVAEGDSVLTPHSALNAELQSVLRELNFLQNRVGRRVMGVSSITTKLRGFLLLYKPKGKAAWFLHLAFYVYVPIFLLLFLFVVDVFSSINADSKSRSEYLGTLAAEIVVISVLGIPPVIFRYFAARIHRRQTAPLPPVTPAEAVKG